MKIDAVDSCSLAAPIADRTQEKFEKGSAQMFRKLLVVWLFVLTLTYPVAVAALVKPDFSGAWVMDRARSFGLPGNMEQTMTVKQTADQMEVETRLIQPNNERTIKDRYVLDGKEYEFNPPTPPNASPDSPPPKGKRTASWLPNGQGIIVTETTTTQTEKGTVTTQVMKKWTFSGEGELTIDSFVDAPQYSYETKRIFSKKKA